MKTTVEQESPTKRKLTIEVEPGELTPHYDETLRRLAASVKVPGFRKGKVPKAILETRIGKDAIREEFFRDVLPALYSQAVEEESIRAVTQPDLDVNEYEEGGPLVFTASVEVIPPFDLPEYKRLKVSRPSDKATQEEIEAQLEVLQNRFGTLEPIGRNAAKGDYVTIDLRAYRHDEQIEQVTADDLSYEVGSGAFVPELDTELEGKRAGDILKFNATLPQNFGGEHAGQEVTLQVVVKEVQMKKLPPLDDEFAKSASEFDTLDELKADLITRIEAVKKMEADIAVRNKLIEQLAKSTDVAVPDAMVHHETQHRLARLIRELEQSGATIEQYLEATGSSQEDLVEAYRSASTNTVAVDLILESIAMKESLSVETDDIETEIMAIARRAGKDPEQVFKEISEAGRVNAMAGDILRRKALEFVVEQADIEDEPS